VEKLVRVRVMNIELGELPAGKYREVTPAECRELMKLIEKSSNTPVIPQAVRQTEKDRPGSGRRHAGNNDTREATRRHGRKKTADRATGRTTE
jgi:23S rRNA pseudouridine2604 synthase